MSAKYTSIGNDRTLWAVFCAFLVRAVFLAVLWWVFVEGDLSSWSVGAPVIMLVATVSVMTSKQAIPRWPLIGWLRFSPYFLWHSILGAVDVAWRAYRRDISLNPIVFDYPMRLTSERAQVFFANAVSLLPGTLSAELHSAHLVVHALDANKPVERDLATLENRVADLFGQTISLARNSG